MQNTNMEAARRDDEVIFDAVLTPHRSLTPRGFLLLMVTVSGISFVAGLFFYLVGAWPVVGFLGLDVLLIYLAFHVNYRHARLREVVRLTRDDLTVQRINQWGEVKSWRFQPTWLQVLMDDPPEHHSQLLLRSHGRTLAIGDFLTPQERLDLARALRRALAKARCAPAALRRFCGPAPQPSPRTSFIE